VYLLNCAVVIKSLRLLLASLLLLLAVAEGIRFTNFYFNQYPTMALHEFQYGLGPAIRAAVALKHRGPVVVSNWPHEPYIYVLFYTQYPPERFQHESVQQSDWLFAPVERFDEFEFLDTQSALATLMHGVFILPGEEPSIIQPVLSIKNDSGETAYKVVVK
jgi:hypothetical protein